MRLRMIALAATAALLSTAVTASAGTVTIKTASEDGNYNTVICPAIVKHIAKKGISGKCATSAGTGENFDATLESGASTVGLVQLDGFGLKVAKSDDEEIEETMGTIGFIVGESLFCAAKKGGRIPQQAAWAVLNDDEPMAEGKEFRISTYREGSGPSLTIGFLREQFEHFGRNTKVLHKKKFKIDVELNRLRSGKRDMVCWVTMANPKDARLKAVVAADDLFLVPFDSPLLTTAKIGKVPAYTVMDVMVTGSLWNIVGGGETVKTITTGVAVALNVDELDDKTYNALVAAVNDPDLLPADGFVGTLLKYQRKAMGGVMDLYKAGKRVVN